MRLTVFFLLSSSYTLSSLNVEWYTISCTQDYCPYDALSSVKFAYDRMGKSSFCCYYKSKLWRSHPSVVFPPGEATRLLNGRYHHVVIFYHQLLRFDAHHAPQYLVQKLTWVHLTAYSSIKPLIVQCFANILKAHPVWRKYLIHKCKIFCFFLGARHQISKNLA